MKKLSLVILCLVFFVAAKAQKDSLIVHYYENFPYAYTESGKPKGIEIDIIEAYAAWMKEKGGSMTVIYKPYKEFSTFYNSVKDGNSRVIGLGSVTINSEREKEVSVSAPYLQNVAVLITAGKVPTIRTRSSDQVAKSLSGLKAIVVNKSSHTGYLNELNAAIAGLKVETTETQNKVLEKIVSDNSYFGFVDIIAYWAFVKSHPSDFLKIQKAFNQPKEYLGFIMPKKSAHLASINEFFESGFGFTATKAYHQILEKYLGHEIIDAVEIK